MQRILGTLRTSAHGNPSQLPAMVLLGLLLVSSVSVAAAQQVDDRRARPAYTGTEHLEDVRPFVAWFRDAVVTSGVDVEPQLHLINDDNADGVVIGARVASYAMDSLELGGTLSFIDINGGGQGTSDLGLYGRYMLNMADGFPDVAVGATAEFPTGSESIGQSTTDFTIFTAMRMHLDNGWDLLANAGLESREQPSNDDRQNGIVLGGGVIMPLNEELAAIGEFNIGSDDYTAATGGVDLELPPGGHLRAAITLGLGERAKDAILEFAFSIPVF